MLNLLRMSILIQRHNYPRAQSLWSHVKSKMAAPTDRKFNGKTRSFQHRVKAPMTSMMAWHRRPNDFRQISHGLLV